MNREIKFRAWYNNELTYFNLFNIRSDGYLRSMDIEDGRPIMQYTGLKDSEGKEIYEGDIVEYKKWFDDLPEQLTGICWIEFRRGTFRLLGYDYIRNDKVDYCMMNHCLDCNYQQEDIKVIGNIHENKELLEGK